MRPLLHQPKQRPNRAPQDDAERRHLTVMFCDLVGSTALSARLDPEDMRPVIGAYHACIAEVISRYQGIIARYMGDGVLVYFGYPQAHEDDAEQAVRAGLALVDAVAKLPTDADAALSARIGIATGVAVVGDLIGEGAAQEQAVVGETPNLAARLQTLAEPGTVLICPNTRRLTGGHFDYRDLGPVALKGWAEPIPVWQVLGTSGVESRFEAMHKTKLPPLFGREEEIELLLRRWRHATQEEGRVVMLTGEPGIGKSHIALALDERLQSEPHITLRYFCSAHHTNSALFPFISQLERAAGFKRSDSPTEKLSKLDALVAQSTTRSGTRGGSGQPFRIAGQRSLPTAGAELRRNARRRHSRRYWLSSMGWQHGSRCSSFSKMSTGSTQPRLSCSRPLWSTCRSFGCCCSSPPGPNSRRLGQVTRT